MLFGRKRNHKTELKRSVNASVTSLNCSRTLSRVNKLYVTIPHPYCGRSLCPWFKGTAVCGEGAGDDRNENRYKTNNKNTAPPANISFHRSWGFSSFFSTCPLMPTIAPSSSVSIQIVASHFGQELDVSPCRSSAFTLMITPQQGQTTRIIGLRKSGPRGGAESKEISTGWAG